MDWNWNNEGADYESRRYYRQELRNTQAIVWGTPPPVRAFIPPSMAEIANLDYESSGRLWLTLWNHDTWNPQTKSWLYGELRDALTARIKVKE